jgi:hypothetical protein
VPISITCSACGAKMRAPDRAAGSKTKCPKCSSLLVIPAAPAAVRLSRPYSPVPSPTGPRERPIDRSEGTAADLAFAIFSGTEPTSQVPNPKFGQDDGPPPLPSASSSNASTDLKPPSRPAATAIPPNLRWRPGTFVLYGLGVAALVLGAVALSIAFASTYRTLALALSLAGLVIGAVMGGGMMVVWRNRNGAPLLLAGAAICVVAAVIVGLRPEDTTVGPNGGMVNAPTPNGPKQKVDTSEAGKDDAERKAREREAKAEAERRVAREKEERERRAQDERDKLNPPSEEPRWTDASKESAQIGNVRVSVSAVVFGIVELHNKIDNSRAVSEEKRLQIRLAVENLDANKIVQFQGWGAARFKGFPSLGDNFDNRYRGSDFGIFDFPVGQVNTQTDIYPGKMVTDVLVFLPPVDGVQYLRLSLPAESFGGKGKMLFHIPAAMISR